MKSLYAIRSYLQIVMHSCLFSHMQLVLTAIKMVFLCFSLIFFYCLSLSSYFSRLFNMKFSFFFHNQKSKNKNNDGYHSSQLRIAARSGRPQKCYSGIAHSAMTAI